ncbi:SWIM zinc finger family protein [Streptomyces parvulus]|nr:SWIM zinc finger family protein [Streptomyces parvulus]
MTPRPADEARRALREARLRGETASDTPTDTPEDTGSGPGSGTGPKPGTPAGEAARSRDRDQDPDDILDEERPARPADLARAALRSTRGARHTGADADAGAPEETTADASSGSGGERVPAISDGPDGTSPRGGETPDAGTPDACPPGAETPAAGKPDAETPAAGTPVGGEGRPGDVAREALRAARRQARADAAGGKAGPGRRPAAPRHPRPTTTGDPRAADARARARAVRDFAADAFRLPPETDPDEQAPAAEEQRPVPQADPESPSTPDASAGESPRTPAAAMPVPGAVPGPAEVSSSVGEPRLASTSPQDPQPPRHRTRPHDAPPPHDNPRNGASPPHDAPSPDNAPSPHGASSPHAAPSPDNAPPPPADVRSSHQHQHQHQDQHQHQTRPTPTPPPPATPFTTPRTTPRTMAAPNRDGDLRRTFPALPPRAADEGLAATWWGNAWVTALEEGALDPARLARGRGYAERGHVDAVTVTPGLVLAYVQGSRPRPYRVQVRLRTLGDDDWQRFLDAAVERPGHIAALLDGELPHTLADCGVPLLPGPGDLAPRCSCPDSGHPCKHAAALCYQTARLLDADPFVLLLLRGRGERALLDALSRLNATRAARAAQDRVPAPLPGVRASAVLDGRPLPTLPAPLPPPPHPEQPPAYPAAPGGPDPFALDQLATDAAARAHALLSTGRDPVGGLTLWQDAARLAAARPGSGLTAGTRALYASLARAAGRDQADLARAVAAWRQGGPEGLDVLEEAWDPPAGRFDRARPLLLAADLPAFRPWRNRLTHPRGHVQLRLGRTGLWYAYESEPGREDWWPRGTPDLDPVGALTGLGASDDL